MTGQTRLFRPCAIIPSRNHWRALSSIVAALRALDLAVFIIDDGSDEPACSALAKFSKADLGGGAVHRFAVNQGKGSAVIQAFHMALAAGYTHALQVDADGQHDLAALPKLLERAKRHPDALVTGVPVYDRSVPLGRAIGRWVTHIWVWIETLSFQIRDSMCGFRVYPLAAVAALLAEEGIRGRRMDFDTEIMVRLFWRGTPVSNLPVSVIYPADNTSNFELWRDNLRISWMHTRLVFRMLTSLPGILHNRPARLPKDREGIHWAWLAERGTGWGLRFCFACYRLLGRTGCRAVLAPIVLYFYLTGREQRQASQQFLARAFRAKNRGKPGFTDSYRHFISFAGSALDTFIGWTGRMPGEAIQPGKVDDLKEAAADPYGAVIIVSHLGNVDLSRALLDNATRNRLAVLVHTHHATNYNKVLREFRTAAAVNTIQVTELGPEIAVNLKERVDRGTWVVIAGDRTPVASRNRVVSTSFLGEPAPLSIGPYLLAALLDCPVYTLFCLREDDRYRLYFEKFADRIDLPRHSREQVLQAHAQRFATRLEEYALRDPYQWYNFFDFWAPSHDAD
ncbi:glycosyltransferase [Dongia soli]|uniref:Glycosyltransferase n=1 Tax=Dongia soli TaxID=600628 RepID=A0ABU5EFN0_9PROT|nr:glycosyltransferase [Dongia soli]MDY0885224.1 glycosyltransferase [Dongia soli]